MPSQNGINGAAVAIVLGGAVLAYSGINGRKVSSIIRDLFQGTNPKGPADPTLTIPTLSGADFPASTGSSASGAVSTGFVQTGSTSQTITNFFRSKGLNNAAIAAILGRWQIESGLNPNSTNPTEGAIGLAQWEGGRRIALQQFAAARGTTETDLMTQLDFAWSELSGSYSGVLMVLRSTNDPATAYHSFQANYEGSASGEAGKVPEGLAAAENWFRQLSGGLVSA